MKRPIAIAFSACVLTLSSSVTGQTPQPVPAQSNEGPKPLEIWFCFDSDVGMPREDFDQIKSSVSRLVQAFRHDYRKVNLIFDKQSVCEKSLPGGGMTCIAQPGIVMCDAAAISRSIRMGGWMAGLTALSLEENPIRIGGVPVQLARFLVDYKSEEELRKGLPYFWPMSDHNFDFDDVRWAGAYLNDWIESETTDKPPSDELPNAGLARYVATLTADYVFAYLLGHEYYHAAGKCPSAEPTSAERIIDLLAQEQDTECAICFNPPKLDEIEADQCALRLVRDVHKGYIAAANQMSRQFAARHAIDVVSQLLLGGLASKEGVAVHRLPSGVELVQFHRPRGYLYAPLRVLAFAGQMRILEASNWEVDLCDAAALDVFRALVSTSYCEGERKFEYASDAWLKAFGGYFPHRTSRALNQMPRPIMDKEDDFACGPREVSGGSP